MVHCKHLLRPLFFVNTVTGLSTVSPNTWEKSYSRCVYACFWLVVYIVEFLFFARRHLNTNEIGDFQMFIWTSNYLLVVHLLLQSVYDHKTVLSAVLSLEAIGDRTEAEGVATAPLDLGYFAAVCLAATNLSLTVVNAAWTWLFSKHVMIFTSYLTSLHYTAMQTAHAFTYLSLMFVALRAEESVNRALRRGLEHETREEFAATRDFRRAKLLKFVREMKGALSHVKEALHDYFKMFITFRFFFGCIFLPRIIHSAVFEQGKFVDPVKNSILVTSFAISSLYALFVLYVHGRITATEPELQTALYEYCLSLRCQEKKKDFRRLTLASLHRRQTPTCWIFGLEFGLIMTLLDTALLVFLSTTSFNKAKG